VKRSFITNDSNAFSERSKYELMVHSRNLF